MNVDADGRPTSGRALPTGTVTFMRTDVEGSMRRARELGADWDRLNQQLLDRVRAAVAAHGGVVVRTEGDGSFAAFPEARAALAAAIDAQRAFLVAGWPASSPTEPPVRVRIGLHSGEAHLAGDDYGGFEVNRAARVAQAGHGGQIVLSSTTAALVEDALPDGIGLRDLGTHGLKDVARPERLYQLDVSGLPVDFPPLRTERHVVGSLPVRVTSFLGRDTDLASLQQLLADSRLVTLTGPGGIGKTSLATELARGQAPAYPDGAWFVALDPIDDPALVRTVVARTIGLFDGPERAAATGLLAYVADRSMLFVLDNFEHVLEASGDVAALLRASPRSRVIVSSRAPLRIPGEQEYPVRPFGPPADGARREGGRQEVPSPDDDPASRLFIERARAIRPDWQPGAEAPVVSDVCRLLDGLPLGIELAAARISLLSPTAIRDRLAARVPLPGSGPRDVPARQRTLESAIAWSYELLRPQERRLLDALSVFEGSFDVQQVEAVVDHDGSSGSVDVLDGLIELVDHSLVLREVDPRATAMPGLATGVRGRLLQTIQTFAADRLRSGDAELDTRRRHALVYLALAEAAAPALPGPDQPAWLDRLALDLANLRTGLRWAIDTGETEIALRYVPALWRFWQLDGHLHEGRQLADAVLTMPGADAPDRFRLAAIAAGGNIAYWQADPETAGRRYREQLDLARALHDPVAEADAVFNLGHVTFVAAGDGPQIAEFLGEAQERFEAIGDVRGVARCEWGRGTVVMTAGRPDEARTTFQALLDRFADLGDVQYHAMTLSSLGWVAAVQGDMQTAARWAVQGLMESHQLRDVASTTLSLQEGVLMAVSAERPEAAALLSGAFKGLCERYGVLPPASLERFLRDRDPTAGARAALGPGWDQLVGEGRAMSLEAAVALTLEVADELAIRGGRPVAALAPDG